MKAIVEKDDNKTYDSKWVPFSGSKLDALCVDYVYTVASGCLKEQRIQLHGDIEDALDDICNMDFNNRERLMYVLNELEKNIGLPYLGDNFEKFEEFVASGKVIEYGKKLSQFLSDNFIVEEQK